MPNAQTYRGFADELDSAAIDAAQALRPITAATCGDFVEGGRLASVIDLAVDVTHSNVSGAVSALAMLAAECRQRAVVCDEYRNDMLRYRRLRRTYLDTPVDERDGMRWPTQPTAPSWADWQ